MEYRPLDDETNEIRVITILPAVDADWKFDPSKEVAQLCSSDIVRCSLEYVSLNDLLDIGDRAVCLKRVSDRQPTSNSDGVNRFKWGDYAALSYAWGDASDTVDLILNGAPVKVTRNLEAGLRMLRDEDRLKGQKLWVDALCINQNDLIERGHQVKRMRNIFGGASKVIVWVGVASDGSYKVAELIRSLLSLIGYTTLKRSNLILGPFLQVMLSKMPPASSYWKAYFDFISRPYWRRLWIIQELAMAKELIVCCGSMTLKWFSLRWLAAVIASNIDLCTELIMREMPNQPRFWVLERLGNIIGLHEFKQHFGNKGLLGKDRVMDQLIKIALAAQATDTRDKVYGILGLLGDEITSQIIPDYNLSVWEVFAGFTRAVLLGTRSLHIIRNGGMSLEKQMPSWVLNPDLWAGKYHQHSFFNAGFEVSPKIEYSEDGKALACQAIRFDTVDGLSEMTGLIIPQHFGVKQYPLGSPSTSAKNAYGDTTQLVKAIWWTLIGVEGPPVWSHPAQSWNLLNIPWLDGAWSFLKDRSCYQAFVAFRKLNKSFQIGGIPFQDFFSHVENDPKNVTETIQALERFIGHFHWRRLMTTSNGYIGIAPKQALPGDCICVLPGCYDPMVLRQIDESFEIVGPCYVCGIMQGEAINMATRGELKLVDIDIR